MKYSIVLFGLALTSCDEQNSTLSQPAQNLQSGLMVATVDLTPKPSTKRWYTVAQRNEGKAVFAQYCASCHGKNAESVETWRKLDSNGNYPPPPLNGTAHAWHHPLEVLDMVIRDGGKPLGGVMPAWGNTLTEDQRLKVIAGFQSYWGDETYSMWLEREKSSRE